MSGNCGTRVFPTEEPEKVDTSSVSLYCNRDLVHNGITVASGENLLKREDVFIVKVYVDGTILSSANVIIQTDTAYKGMFTYYIKGKTTLDNTFTDSLTIFYK
jgi:hypothetical protein